MSDLSIGEDEAVLTQLENRKLELTVNSSSSKCEVGIESRRFEVGGG